MPGCKSTLLSLYCCYQRYRQWPLWIVYSMAKTNRRHKNVVNVAIRSCTSTIVWVFPLAHFISVSLSFCPSPSFIMPLLKSFQKKDREWIPNLISFHPTHSSLYNPSSPPLHSSQASMPYLDKAATTWWSFYPSALSSHNQWCTLVDPSFRGV